MGASPTDLPPEAYRDDPWVEVLPWLMHYPAGSLRDLTDLSPSHDWWLTECPALTTMVVDHFDLCAALSRVLIARHADSPLGQSLPTLPPQLPVSALPAGSRVRTTFQRLDAHTIRDLVDVTIKDLFDTRGTGPGTVEEAVTALIAAAITLPPEHLQGSSRSVGADPLTGTISAEQPAAHAQLLEDLTRVAGWRHIRAMSDKPLFDIGVEAMAPEEIQEAVQRINSLTSTDVRPSSPQADPVEELTLLVARLDEHQRTLLHDRLLATVPRDHADIAAGLGIPMDMVRHIEVRLNELLERTFHFGTAIGNLLASIRVEIRPVAAIDRLIRLHPELAVRIPELDVPLWHVLDRLDDYFEVTDGWAAAPHTDAAREYTRTWLEDTADSYGVATIEDLTATSTMPRPELVAWLEWCGYPVRYGYVLTRTETIGDHSAGLLAIAGAPLMIETIVRQINPDLDPQAVQDALDSDDRFQETAPATWALVDPKESPDVDIREQIAARVDAAEGGADLRELIGSMMHDRDVSASSILEAIASNDFELLDGRLQRKATAQLPRKSPAETRRLFQHTAGFRLRITVTRDHLRGSGFPVPAAVPAIVNCAEGSTVELDSRLGTQTIRWSGPQPMSGSIKRFLDDLESAEDQVVFLDFRHDGLFDVIAAPSLDHNATPLATALMLTGAAPADNDDDAIAMLATAAGLPSDARPRQVLSAYQQRGDEDIARDLELLWTRPPTTTQTGPVAVVAHNERTLTTAATEQPIPADETDISTDDSSDHADWIPVPDGYRSVGWVRQNEAHAAVEAYRRRRDTPILNHDAVVGWARFDPGNAPRGRVTSADVRLIRVSTRRERAVCWITEQEAAAVISAASRRRTVMLSPPGGNWSGQVVFYPADSAEAIQFRSTTRLLRAGKASGISSAEGDESTPGDPDDARRGLRAE